MHGGLLCLTFCLSVQKKIRLEKIHILENTSDSKPEIGQYILDFLLNKYAKWLHSKRIYSSQHVIFFFLDWKKITSQKVK